MAPRPDDAATFVVPVGNDRRFVKCSCGATFEVPTNALSVTCQRCGMTYSGPLGVQQR
jgi:hypothetical protein